MVMIPWIMGMSIDNSIHVYHSYEELGKGSLGRVLGSAGLSSLLASLTNAAGFLGLLFCHPGGLLYLPPFPARFSASDPSVLGVEERETRRGRCCLSPSPHPQFFSFRMFYG